MKRIISVLVACACLLATIPFAFSAMADDVPPKVLSGEKSLCVYDFVHGWDTVKLDIKKLMGTAVPAGRKVKLSVEISYLVGAQTEKNDLPFAPKVHISTDAQNVKEFTFSSDVKATTKKWVTFSGDITCDLGDTVGNKIEWAYITLFAPGETDISVYVDDIKISGENGVLLEQGFEDFDESATVEDLKVCGLQTQWGGGENECRYKITAVKKEEEKAPELARTGEKSLCVYDFVHGWDTVKLDIKKLMGTAVPAGRKVKLSVEISYLVGAQTEKNDLPFAPKVHISTDAQNVKEFTFSSDVKATTKKWVTFSGDITCDLGDTVGNKIEWAYITLFAPGETDISVYVDDIKISGENGVLLEQGFEDFDESATVEDLKTCGLQTQWGGGPNTECSFKIISVKKSQNPDDGKDDKPDDDGKDDNGNTDEPEQTPSIVHGGTKALLVYDLVHSWDTAKIEMKKLQGINISANKTVTLHIEISYLLKSDKVIKNHPMSPKAVFSADEETSREYEFSSGEQVMASTGRWATFKGDLVCDLSMLSGDTVKWAYVSMFNVNSTEIDVYVDDISIEWNGKVIAQQDFEALKPSATVELLKSNGIQTQWSGGPESECSLKIVSTEKEVIIPPDQATGWKGDVCKGTKALRIYDRVEEYVSPMFDIRRSDLVGYKVKAGDIFEFDVSAAYKLGAGAKAEESLYPIIQINYKNGVNQQFWSTTTAGVKVSSESGWGVYSGKISCDFTDSKWQTKGSSSVPEGSEIERVILKVCGGTFESGTEDIYIDELSVMYKGVQMCPYGSFEMLADSQINTAGFFFEYGGIGKMAIVEGKGAAASDRDGSKFRLLSNNTDIDSVPGTDTVNNNTANGSQGKDNSGNKQSDGDIKPAEKTKGGIPAVLIISIAAVIVAAAAAVIVIIFVKKANKKRSVSPEQ